MENYGRVTNMPWGVIFPGSDGNPRHPSQIYEASLEGILIFVVVSYLAFNLNYLKQNGRIAGVFLILYALCRILVENFREPDIQLGFIYRAFTMGQLLSIPMILAGLYFIFNAKNSKLLKVN